MMTTTRAWTAATAAICVLLVLAAWFLLIAPRRGEATDLRAQKTAQQQSSAVTRRTIHQLEADDAALPAKLAELAQIKRQLPPGPQLAPVVDTLSAMAASAGVTLVSVAPAQPAALGASGAPAAVGAATAGAVTAGAVTAGGATSGATGSALIGIETTIVVRGTYRSSTLFLQKLQSAGSTTTGAAMDRAFLVQNVTVKTEDVSAPAAVPSGKGQVVMTVLGQFFVLSTGPVPTARNTP